jgi:hypothetical protein
MGLIKQPLDIDFVVDPRLLTKKEQLAISEFVKADKAKRALLKKRSSKKRLLIRQSRPVDIGTNR